MKRWIIAVLMLLIVPMGALAVDYSITGYHMRVVVLPDGSAEVTETLQYDFDGEYNGILSSFDVGDVQSLEDLRLFVDGQTELTRVDEMNKEPFTYVAEKEGKLVKVRAYAPGGRGERTFQYTYRLTGLVRRYQDAARLNYKLIGVSNDETLRGALIELEAPGEILDAWAHGAMRTSDLAVRGNTLIGGPADVRPGQFAELDVLIDPAAFLAAPVEEKRIVDEVRAQEEALLQQEALSAARAQQRRGVARTGTLTALAAFCAGFALWLSKLRRARGFNRPVQACRDMDVLKGLPAAHAQFILRDTIDTDGLTGTLMELVQMGMVKMYAPEDERGVSFERVLAVAGAKEEHRALALNWLFPDGRRLWIDSLNAGNDYKRASAFSTGYDSYCGAVRREVAASGVVYTGGKGTAIALSLVIGVLLTVLLGIFAPLWMMALPIAVTVALVVGFSRLRRLTDAGEEILAALKGFEEKYAAAAAAPDAEMLPYIPLAAALGCLESMFGGIERMAQDDHCAANTWMPYWMYYGWYRDVGRARNTMHEVREHNQSVPDPDAKSSGSAPSSGGGGGGGGHGAW